MRATRLAVSPTRAYESENPEPSAKFIGVAMGLLSRKVRKQARKRGVS